MSMFSWCCFLTATAFKTMAMFSSRNSSSEQWPSQHRFPQRNCFPFHSREYLDKTVTLQYYSTVSYSFFFFFFLHIIFFYLQNKDSYEIPACHCRKLLFWGFIPSIPCHSADSSGYIRRSLRRWSGLSNASDFHYSARLWSLSIIPTLTV